MTEYLVFVRDDGMWLEVGSEVTRSARSAITAHLGRDGDGPMNGSEYVAVPARSWRPVTVKVETKTQLKFN